jgi:protein KRI1
VLTINAKYAARFEHNKKREEKHRLEEKARSIHWSPYDRVGDVDAVP